MMLTGPSCIMSAFYRLLAEFKAAPLAARQVIQHQFGIQRTIFENQHMERDSHYSFLIIEEAT
jgi:hypothetical protein